jgi:hypothetical protein
MAAFMAPLSSTRSPPQAGAAGAKAPPSLAFPLFPPASQAPVASHPPEVPPAPDSSLIKKGDMPHETLPRGERGVALSREGPRLQQSETWEGGPL